MKRRFEAWALLSVLVGGFAGTGCSPKIGDKCTVSTDCSTQGDRLCDPTEPGGYCTIFNCEPNTCPDDSICVAFQEPSCSSPALSRRFQRAFCMAPCQSDGDCRAQYACVDTTGDPLRQVVDLSPATRKICTVPGSVAASPVDPPVCSAPRPDAAPESGSESEASVLPESGTEAEAASGSSAEAPDDAGVE